MDIRLISKIRIILALSTLAVTYLDPSEPQRYVAQTYTTLILYNLYAVALYLFSFRKPNLVPVNIAHWVDVGWYLILIAFSSGTNSIYFFLFFFPIQTGSFRFGFLEGFRVTVVSAVLFAFIGYLTAPTGEDFELNRFLLRIVYLSVLGYMIAYWGGQEFTNKRRLAILKDINKLYNPRFGVDQTVGAILQKIIAFFDADSCLLIFSDPLSFGYILRQSYRAGPEQSISAEAISDENPLMKLAGEKTIIYYDLERKLLGRAANFLVYDSATGERIEAPRRDGEVLADLLETKSFISVPLYRREAFAGRLYLTSQRKIFSQTDLEFLKQLLEHAVPVVENVNLLDRLASEATERQRLKISRDIHDSTVQPYIGIKLGLEALQIKQAAGEDITGDIDQLVGMANANIAGIRSYINRLKDDNVQSNKGVVLVSAIRQQAEKIGEFYGIRIDVASDGDIHISDRLAAEVFQIVTEGLSNVKRHTKASRAGIKIKSDDKMLKLEIENNVPDGAVVGDFVPKSIVGRAHALGGRAFVKNTDGQTKVSVEIPL